MVFGKSDQRSADSNAGIWTVQKPFLIILTSDDRLPLLFLVSPTEVEEQTMAELAETIIERMAALQDLLQGKPVAILCDGTTKSFRALLCAKMSSRMDHHSAIFMQGKDKRYRSVNGQDLGDVLDAEYILRA